MLCQMERIARFQNLQSQISDLKSLAESCSRQLRGFAESLQNSDISGQRYLTDATRQAEHRSVRRADFDQKLNELVRRGRAGRSDQGEQAPPS